VVWGLFFIALIYWSAPAYGVLARLFEAKAGLPFNAIDPMLADTVVITASRLAELPVWVTGLLVAGGISAAFSTVSGMLITGSASFAYDIYPRLIRPGASESDRVYVAKGFFLVLAAAVMALALNPWGMIAEIAALAFALAGNTIFPAFLLGIWWGRANAAGVIVGMLCGVVLTFASLFFGESVPLLSTFIPPTASAFLGAPLVLIVMVLVSLVTAPPSSTMCRFLARDVHDCPEE
jgi:cation/acetate symporter